LNKNNLGNEAVTLRIQEHILQPGNLHYSIAIPKNSSEDQQKPLILALHFAGYRFPFCGKQILTELAEPALRELGAFIVAPDCTGPDWTHSRSEADVLTILDHIYKTYPIDPAQTLITGYSMGGIGTWYLAARHQELFSAALIMAGTPPPNIARVEWQIPHLIIQSRQDEIMPPQPTISAVEQLKENGRDVELILLDGVTHFETWRYTVPLHAAMAWIQKAWKHKTESVR
jgi:predicted peptidase